MDEKDRSRAIGQLAQIREGFHFTATRVGEPGCRARLEAADNLWAIDQALTVLREGAAR